MNTYPSYKDSGVEWIGEIPNGWNIVKTKYMTSPRKELSDSGKEELLSNRKLNMPVTQFHRID
jgi:type I restriction enzyme S subunit